MYDGNNGGKSYTSIKGMKTILLSSKDSGCFTLMGVNSITREPVLCICILAANVLSVTDVKVFDYCTSILYDSSNTMVGNMGEDKELPGLTVCKFR